MYGEVEEVAAGGRENKIERKPPAIFHELFKARAQAGSSRGGCHGEFESIFLRGSFGR